MEEQAKRPPVGGKESGYLFEFQPDGVYLTVYPDDGSGVLFELSDIRQILHDNGVREYDIIELSRIVREASGVPKKLADTYLTLEEIGEQPPLGPMGSEMLADDDSPEAGIVVEISKDRMEATVKFDASKGTRLPSAERVREELAKKNVVFGIDDEAIASGIKGFTPFVAAKGDPAIDGENARIERNFDLGVKGRPKVIDQYDRVDYKDMNLFVLAKKGDIVAVRIPQTEGHPGMSVLGTIVKARNGKPIPVPQGKNTEIRNEHELVSLIDGQIVDSGRKIDIDPHLVISSDVGVGTGNVDFVGSVEIKGGVEAGFIVKATGDIEIKGNVNGGIVEGKNIFIGGGIIGMGRGKVTAREDIRCAFTENVSISAERDIYVADVALHSNMCAGKHIFVEDKRGMITGGSAAAGEEIRCKIIGNQSYVVTRVAVGINPTLQERYRELCKSYKENKDRLKKITQMLNTLGKIDISRLPQDRINQINELTRSQFPLAGQLKREEKEIQVLDAELGKMKNGKIRINDTVYPGVRVSVNNVMMNVQSEIKCSTLSVKDDRVSIGPY